MQPLLKMPIKRFFFQMGLYLTEYCNPRKRYFWKQPEWNKTKHKNVECRDRNKGVSIFVLLGFSLPVYRLCQEGNDFLNLRKCHGWDKSDLFRGPALCQRLRSKPRSAASMLAEGTEGFCYVNSPELNAFLLHSLFWRNKLKVLS